MINQLELRHIELLQHTIGVTQKNREPYVLLFDSERDKYYWKADKKACSPKYVDRITGDEEESPHETYNAHLD
ncbi:hypothetical protein OZ843_000319 [Yersinia enterocolitica]